MNMIRSPLSAGIFVYWLLTIGALDTNAQHAKQLIEVGWAMPNTSFMRTNFAMMDRDTPFSGVTFKFEATNDSGQTITADSAWDNQPWKRAWLQPALTDLKACRFTKLTNNFLRLNATPGNLNWSDDSGWAVLAYKAASMAWLCREGGARGLVLDFESYGARQFEFGPTNGLTFGQTAALARKRGRQFVEAIGRDFPNATLLSFWLNSINVRAGEQSNPDDILATEGYGLLPAFVNGILEGAPAAMVLVDGCENGYYLNSALQYLQLANAMRSWNGACMSLVAPELREKYRRQVQAGFGFYLDMYENEPGNQYYFPPLDGSRLKRLQRNLGFAVAAADEYVWVYGEQCKWWDCFEAGAKNSVEKMPGKGRYWEAAIPGITRAIRWVGDPETAALEQINSRKQTGSVTNLLENPQFKDGSGKLPKHWETWQGEGSKGSFAWDAGAGDGSARAESVKDGVFLQKVHVKPGENYYVEARSRRQGTSITQLMIRWQTEEGKWIHWVDDKTFTFKLGSGEWECARGVVTVPEEAGQLVLLLVVRNQLSANDACWFDDAVVYRVEP